MRRVSYSALFQYHEIHKWHEAELVWPLGGSRTGWHINSELGSANGLLHHIQTWANGEKKEKWSFPKGIIIKIPISTCIRNIHTMWSIKWHEKNNLHNNDIPELYFMLKLFAQNEQSCRYPHRHHEKYPLLRTNLLPQIINVGSDSSPAPRAKCLNWSLMLSHQ